MASVALILPDDEGAITVITSTYAFHNDKTPEKRLLSCTTTLRKALVLCQSFSHVAHLPVIPFGGKLYICEYGN
eukprot:scaffold182262_cov20-Prasinocladus_malaysianus.AAC.1